MSQAPLACVLLVVAWLLALGARRRIAPDLDQRLFNLMQVGLLLLTALAMVSLAVAISTGLLGHPDMQIAGNGSSSQLLKWYQDHSGAVLPRAWVLSVPMYVYRLLMLTWALWIPLTLLKLLKWGWESITLHALWHRLPERGVTRRGGAVKQEDEDFTFE